MKGGEVLIREVSEDMDLMEYLRMRRSLWPHHDDRSHLEDIHHMIKGEPFYKNELTWKVYIVERNNGNLGGFIELSLYPELDFCDSKPVGYIEGWYVDEDLRRKGFGKELVHHGIEWAKKQRCSEIASDVEVENSISLNAHRNLGFVETHQDSECIYYKKALYM